MQSKLIDAPYNWVGSVLLDSDSIINMVMPKVEAVTLAVAAHCLGSSIIASPTKMGQQMSMFGIIVSKVCIID